MMTLRIKSWKKFQHYSKRKPPWIKLYRSLLDDPEWHRLSGDATKSLAGCWLVASERDGELPDVDTLAFRLRIDDKALAKHISELEHWVTVSDSDVLAQRSRHATPETETETETEHSRKPAQKRLGYSEDFERFWKSWPGDPAGSKKNAYSQWKKTLNDRPDCDSLISMVDLHERCRRDSRRRGEFVPTWPHCERWIKRHGWDELKAQQPQTVKMCTLNGIGPMFPLRVPVDQREQRIAELAEKGIKAS